MNQLEAPVQDTREHLSTVAESLPPAPSMLKGMKRHDRPEVDHDDDKSQHQDGDYSANQHGLHGSSDDCEPMVNYDGFESVGTFGNAALPCFEMADHDDDVVNVRSPIICKPSSNARRSTLSPTCVSALARDKNDEFSMPSWTIQEFQEYLGMLELLQDVCSNSESEELCLSADNLGQMERLLTSLLPQGV